MTDEVEFVARLDDEPAVSGAPLADRPSVDRPHLAAALRDLPSSLPYTRLFGAHFNSHFVGGDDASRADAVPGRRRA